MTDNIRPIETGKPDPRKAAMATLQRLLNTDAMQEALLLAKFRKIQFDAYVTAGFTPEQALSLVIGPKP